MLQNFNMLLSEVDGRRKDYLLFPLIFDYALEQILLMLYPRGTILSQNKILYLNFDFDKPEI